MKWFVLALFVVLATTAEASMRQQPAEAPVHAGGGEASLVLPDLGQVSFLGVNSRTLLMSGIGICVLGLLFGLVSYSRLQKLPVHRSMLEVSELIYETCKTYLVTQGKFILILEIFVGLIIALYFGLILHFPLFRVGIILLFSLIGIAGSYGVAWFGIRVNTFANSRMAFASLRGKPYPLHAIPLEAGMSIGMLLISVELFIMLCILLFIPRDLAGSCFLGFAIGESLGASALRIAGGIFTKIADIGADLMKIVFNIKEDDARNPGVIADCTGDNAGDSVGPSADGFETYGVTGVALITFILTAVPNETVQVQLLVWIFMIRVMMVVASGCSYLINGALMRAKYSHRHGHELRNAADGARLADLDRVGRHDVPRFVSADSRAGRRHDVVEAVDGHHVRHARRRHHSGAREGLHVDRVGARARGRVVVARRGRVAEHPCRARRRQLQRVLARAEHRRADERRVLGEPDGVRCADDCGARVRVRSRRVRLPRHGPGDDCGRFIRPGHRQRAVGLRALGHRRAARHQGRDQAGLRVYARLHARRSTCSRKTTAPATRSRRRRSRC